MEPHDTAQSRTSTLARNQDPVHVLLVEDDPDDLDLLQEALAEVQVPYTPHLARDGREAVRSLNQEGPYADRPVPDLILLDLDLPHLSGREILQHVKSHPGLKHIPVVVFSTSLAEEDLLQCYRWHAAAYVAKPVHFNEFVEVVRSMADFWLQTVHYAPRD